MVIQIKELAGEECKIKRIKAKIRKNGKLNRIEVRVDRVYDNKIEYTFTVLKSSWFGRHLSLISWTVRFWAIFDIKTCTLRIGNVEEHLFDNIYAASQKLFSDIDELTVIIEKDYC